MASPRCYACHGWSIGGKGARGTGADGQWYERSRRGLGAEFLLVLREVVASLEEGSAVTSPVQGEPRARRVLLPRFPFAVVFTEAEDAFVIVAVAHQKRKPGYWSSRL